MRVITDNLARQNTAAVAVAAGLGGALALYALYVFAGNRKGASKLTSKLHSLPSHSAVLGDLLEFARNAPRLHEWIAETSLEFGGEPWRIHLPGIKTLVVVTSPVLIEDVLTTQFDTFPHGDRVNELMMDLLGTAIVTSDGERWYHQRKAAAKFFTARSLRICMTTQMRKNLSQVYSVMDSTIAQGEAVNMLKLFHEFALQTFAEVGLGIDLNVIGSAEDHPMSHNIEIATPPIIRREAVPWFYWKLQRWLNVGSERVLADAMKNVHAWLDKVVEQSLSVAAARQAQARHKSQTNEMNDEVKSVVELFLEQSGDDKAGLQAADLKDFILTFVLGARGTSAAALAWAFLMLTRHPEVEQRIRDEMAEQLPEVMTDDEAYVTSEDIRKLVYLEATIKEVVRLYPTIPMNRRQAMTDTVIGDGIPIQKGDYILLHPYAMARLPNLWGPDAAEFKPERWIDPTTGELLTVPSSKFSAFSSGPRICIGMRLAMLELRVVTANLLKRYRFALAEPNDGSHVVSIELMLANPLIMTATRTKQDASCT
jgi:cytochrome P450